MIWSAISTSFTFLLTTLLLKNQSLQKILRYYFVITTWLELVIVQSILVQSYLKLSNVTFLGHFEQKVFTKLSVKLTVFEFLQLKIGKKTIFKVLNVIYQWPRFKNILCDHFIITLCLWTKHAHHDTKSYYYEC